MTKKAKKGKRIGKAARVNREKQRADLSARTQI